MKPLDGRYLLEGIQRGFRIGFDYTSMSLKSAKVNMQSAMQNAAMVSESMLGGEWLVH